MNKGIRSSIAAALTGVLFSLPLVACSTDYSVKLTDVNDFVSVHTSAQAAYIASSDYNGISADGKSEQSRPKALRLKWNADDSASFTVELSRDEEFEDCTVYHTGRQYIDVYNLYLDSVYSWRVTAEFPDGKSTVSDPSYFMTTGAAPRNIYVDGVTNVRDLGGWAIQGGDKKVKQGMIYRCGRLNKSKQENVEIEITKSGISTMKGELGIKAEIDLRRPDYNHETGGIEASPLGEGVAYYNVPMNMDVSNANKIEGNAEGIKDFFALLGDRNNYPLIFHCDIGTDRTGMCAFLINGLMGVAEENLYRDYLFSNFGKIGSKRALTNITGAYVNAIKAYSGDTLAQKIKNYLVNEIGVAASDIDTMCEMLSGD